MHDRISVATEISAAIEGAESGEVRIRWSTDSGQRVVEMTRIGTWTIEADLAIWDPAEQGQADQVSESSRAARKAAEVDRICGLLEEFGFDAVKLDTVRTLLGLSKTTAYYRLTEARTHWKQRSAS